MNKVKICALQMPSFAEKETCVQYLREKFADTAKEHPDFVVLPEMFACPYASKNFPVYAEEDGGFLYQALSDLAAEHNVYLVGGTFPERDGDHVYNTCYIFDRQGSLIAKHRKAHLFDIDVRGGQHFRESDTLTAGDKATVFETEFGTMGAAVCYDIRFPEFFRKMTLAGAKLVFLPAAFNMTTGPAHWELSIRARALDNQFYVLACSQARKTDAGYVSWGHTMIASPWGNVIGELDEKEGALSVTIDLDECDSIREQLPLLKHRRPELYT